MDVEAFCGMLVGLPLLITGWIHGGALIVVASTSRLRIFGFGGFSK